MSKHGWAKFGEILFIQSGLSCQNGVSRIRQNIKTNLFIFLRNFVNYLKNEDYEKFIEKKKIYLFSLNLGIFRALSNFSRFSAKMKILRFSRIFLNFDFCFNIEKKFFFSNIFSISFLGIRNFTTLNQGVQNFLQSREINQFNQNQISPFFDILLKLFNSQTDQTVNKALIEMRDSNIIKAVGFGLIIGHDQCDRLVNKIIDLVGHFVQRFPFDSTSEQEANIRVLHKSLQGRLLVNFVT